MKEHISAYYQLRSEIDQHIDYLWGEHNKHMACKKGCDLCCLDFDVFPVEPAAIKEQIETEYPDILNDKSIETKEGTCAYLHNHACSIYNARPLICRTHGFPLVNMNEAGDQWELSFCHLNFNDVDDDYFDEDAIYEQDTYNSKLFVLNKNYLQANPDLGYNELDLVPLRSLLKI